MIPPQSSDSRPAADPQLPPSSALPDARAGEPPSSTSRQMAAFAYFFVAASGIFVLAVKRDDDFVRFHAIQSILATLAFFGFSVLLRLLSSLPLIGFLYHFLFELYTIGLFLYWMFLMVQAYRGEKSRVPYLGTIVEDQISG